MLGFPMMHTYQKTSQILVRMSSLPVGKRFPEEVCQLQRLFKTMALDAILIAGDYAAVSHGLKIIQSKYKELLQKSILSEIAIHANRLLRHIDGMSSLQRIELAIVIEHCRKFGNFDSNIITNLAGEKYITEVRTKEYTLKQILALVRTLSREVSLKRV